MKRSWWASSLITGKASRISCLTTRKTFSRRMSKSRALQISTLTRMRKFCNSRTSYFRTSRRSPTWSIGLRWTNSSAHSTRWTLMRLKKQTRPLKTTRISSRLSCSGELKSLSSYWTISTSSSRPASTLRRRKMTYLKSWTRQESSLISVTKNS